MTTSFAHQDRGTARAVSIPSAVAFSAGVLLTAIWFAGSLWPASVHPGRFCLIGAELAASSGQFAAALGAPVAVERRCPPG